MALLLHRLPKTHCKTGKASINDRTLIVDDNTVDNNINTPAGIFGKHELILRNLLNLYH